MGAARLRGAGVGARGAGVRKLIGVPISLIITTLLQLIYLEVVTSLTWSLESQPNA